MANILGTDGDDQLQGTTENDTIEGGAGNDSLEGGDGNDLLDGGSGDDYMAGGAGDDVYVVDGADGVWEAPGEGTDEVRSYVDFGLPEDFENLTALGDGNIYLGGNGLDNTITGNAGDNYMRGEGGSDTLDGGDGWDISANGLPYGTIGSLRVVDGPDGTLLVQLVQDDGSFEDVFSVTINGPGSATVTGLGMMAGSGTDTVTNIEDLHFFVDSDPTPDNQFVNIQLSAWVPQSPDFLHVSGSAGADVIDLAALYPDVPPDTPINAGGGRGDDAIYGNDGGNYIGGDQGNDVIDGRDGDDTLAGGQGDDSLSGGIGNDYIDGEGGNDSIDGGDGSDIAAFRLPAGTTGSLRVVDGPDGTLLVQLVQEDWSFEDVFAVSPGVQGGATVTGLGMMADFGTDVVANVEDLHFFVDGTTGDQFVNVPLVPYVPQSPDFLHVAGSVTADTIDLAELYPEVSTDTPVNANGGLGDDQIYGNEGGNYIEGNEDNDTIDGRGGDDAIIGGDGNDNLAGGAGNDYLEGGSGDDFMAGGAGDDVYLAGAGDGIVENADEGTDEVRADVDWGLGDNIENLTAIEGSGAFYLGGNSLDNVITGNSADNYMYGGGGNDTLDGGDGRDVAAFHLPHGTTGSMRMVDGPNGTILVQLVQDNGSFEDVFSIAIAGSGSATVTGLGIAAGEGTDTVVSVEELHFFVDTYPDDTPDNQFVFVSLSAYVPPLEDNFAHVSGSDGGDFIDLAALYPDAGPDANINSNGGAGDDTILGTEGWNYLRGDAGNDTIDGRGGGDSVAFGLPAGMTGTLRVVQGIGDQTGSLVVERVDGETVEQLFIVSFAEDGTTTVQGINSAAFLGTDTVSNAGALDFVVDNPEFDPNQFVNIILPVAGTDGPEAIYGSDQSDLITGAGAGDSLYGFAGDDILLAGAGNDFLRGGDGNDIVDGGDGHDRASFFDSLVGVQVDLNLQGQAQDTGQGMDTLVGIESVSGTVNDDILIGDDGANSLWGSGGNDTLSGNGGDDYLGVSDGDHLLDGGDGSDSIAFVNEPLDASGPVTVDLNLTDAQWTGIGTWTISNVENVGGGDFNDVLTGNAEANILAGGVGNDRLTGGAGNDLLLGDGYIAVGNSDPSLSYSLIEDGAEYGAVGNDVLRGGDGDDTIIGGSGRDSLFGDAGDDHLDAGVGDDFVSTGFGNNLVLAGEGYDFVRVDIDGAVADTVYVSGSYGDVSIIQGGVTNRVFEAEELMVLLSGDALTLTTDASGYDGAAGGLLVLNGHNGSDIMIGSAGAEIFANVDGQVLGNDIFTGNGGADIFDYTFAISGMNGDTITDFDSDDVIDLSYNDSVNNGSGLLANTFIGNAAFSGVAGEYRYYSAGGQTFVEADTDGDGVADQMLTLANGEYALVETEAGSNILAKANLINGTDLRDIIDGTSDRDVIHGGLGNDTLRGNEGDDALYGEAGNDFLDGGAGNDILEGDDGNDTLSGRSGFNILDGGDGFDSSSAEADVATGDTVVITGGGAHVTVSQGGVVTNEIYNSEEVLVRAAGTGGTLTFDASNFVGTPDSFLWMVDHDGTDVMIGSASSEGFANVWVNVSGADVFTGNGGADIFDYTWAVAGMNGDTITDFDFDDVIDLSLNGSTELWGNGGYLADHFIGGADFSGIAGEYRFSAHDGMTFVEADTDGDGLADQVLTLANGEYALVETLAGSNILMRANALIGTEGADVIVGTGDRDVIQGLGGGDTLRGGTGDDQIFGGAGNDRLVGNGGNDTLDGGAGDDIINTGFGTTVVSGGEGYDVVYAELDNSLSDTVYVTGTSGSVTIAQGGTVTNQVNDAEEVLVWTYGSAGTVTLDASGYVSTGEAILWLVDHDGSDVMIGSDGNDYFGNVSINLSGSDVFTGNGGSDLFDYTYAVGGMNNDTIMDFEFDETIDLRFNDSTNQNYEGALLCDTFIGNAAFSGVAGEYRYSAHDGQTFVEADTNGDALADQVLTIANGEFVLVETFAGSNILKQAASGVAADGLLAGATVFMDVNGDGLWNEGEAITITDADGRFLFDSPSVGTLVVTGGTNVDTGLPNLVTMSAPLGSGVVNPLTTLVQALVESSSGAMTADDAAAAVASALGISGSIDLLNTDVYSAAAAGDADALAAQKAAATVVALIAATADAAGADAGEQAIANLAELIGGGGAVDLTDEETIGQVLDGAMPSDQVDSVAAGVADAAEQIAETTSLDELSDAQADALTRGNDLDNILVGGNQSDDLVGLGGSDQMSAGAGDDRLDGGLGADLLVGGSGADVFAFTSVGDSVPGASDLISDFSGHWTLVTNANGKIGKVKGDWDLIDLSEIDANSNVDGDQAFTLSKKFTGSAGQAYSDYDSTNGITNVHLDVDGDAVADMTIQLQGQANLVGADFIL